MNTPWTQSDVGLTLAVLPLLMGYFWWVARVRSKLATQDPHCRRCNYIVKGLPSERCPECGARLYPRGISFPGTFSPLPLRKRIERWSMGVLVVGSALLLQAIFAHDDPHYSECGWVVAILTAAWIGGVMILTLRQQRSRAMAK